MSQHRKDEASRKRRRSATSSYLAEPGRSTPNLQRSPVSKRPDPSNGQLRTSALGAWLLRVEPEDRREKRGRNEKEPIEDEPSCRTPKLQTWTDARLTAAIFATAAVVGAAVRSACSTYRLSSIPATAGSNRKRNHSPTRPSPRAKQ